MKYQICIVESRDLIFEVEADSQEDAEEIAMESEDFITDSFRERVLDWAVKL